MFNFFKKKFGKKNTEEAYYEQLFIKNPLWSARTPNEEELARWQLIESFLLLIKQRGATTSKPNILDIGCGRGWLSNLLSNYGKVTGIEPVKPVVKHAWKLFPNIDIKAGTADTLIKAGYLGSYDIIVCSEVIEHIHDSEKLQFVLKLKKLLSDDGFLIVTTPRKEAEDDWRKYCSPDQPVEDWISENSLRNLFERTGFSICALKRLSISPADDLPEVEIYQLWLVQNNAQ